MIYDLIPNRNKETRYVTGIGNIFVYLYGEPAEAEGLSNLPIQLCIDEFGLLTQNIDDFSLLTLDLSEERINCGT